MQKQVIFKVNESKQSVLTLAWLISNSKLLFEYNSLCACVRSVQKLTREIRIIAKHVINLLNAKETNQLIRN